MDVIWSYILEQWKQKYELEIPFLLCYSLEIEVLPQQQNNLMHNSHVFLLDRDGHQAKTVLPEIQNHANRFPLSRLHLNKNKETLNGLEIRCDSSQYTSWGREGLSSIEYSLKSIPGPNSSSGSSFNMVFTCIGRVFPQ